MGTCSSTSVLPQAEKRTGKVRAYSNAVVVHLCLYSQVCGALETDWRPLCTMLCTASIPGTPGTYFEHVVCSSHEAVLSTRRQYVAQQSRYVLSKWCVFMVYHVPEDHTVVMYFYQLSANC